MYRTVRNCWLLQIECSSSLKKDELRRVILEHLHEEELISDDEDVEQVNSATLELKKLEFQEKERARETALRMKELEVKEKELAMQVKLKELEARATPLSPELTSSRPVGFDISKHVRFVPPFQEREVDKYFFTL